MSEQAENSPLELNRLHLKPSMTLMAWMHAKMYYNFKTVSKLSKLEPNDIIIV